MKKSNLITAIVIFVVFILIIAMCFDGSSSGGDGKSTCRNCGRSKSLSYAGYCSTCQSGFEQWQDRYYGND